MTDLTTAAPESAPLTGTHAPTRKWWAAFITALAAFAVNWITVGMFDKPIAIALVGLIAQSLVSYLLPNGDAPAGASIQRRRRTR